MEFEILRFRGLALFLCVCFGFLFGFGVFWGFFVGYFVLFCFMRGLTDVYQLTPVSGNGAVGRELFILIRLSELVFRLTSDFPSIICTSSLLLWIIFHFLV